MPTKPDNMPRHTDCYTETNLRGSYVQSDWWWGGMLVAREAGGAAA